MQTYFWIGLNIFLLIAMVVLVPRQRIKDLFSFGLIGGILLAIVVFYLFSVLWRKWEVIGGINIFGLDLLPIIAWFFPTIIFAHFFPKGERVITKVGYVLLFAVGAIFVNYIFIQLDMWKSYNWNYFYTFLLALAAHTILSIYILNT